MLFGLFGSKRFQDPLFGEFHLARGKWRGSISLPPDGHTVPLIADGSRQAPDPRAIAVAKTFDTMLDASRSDIERDLFTHYEPYREAVASGEMEHPEPLPTIAKASEVWAHIIPAYVAVYTMGGIITLELGCYAVWDEEHTLGIRFRNSSYAELCGSTLCP